MFRRSPTTILAVLFLAVATSTAAQSTEYDGAAALGLSLRRLGTTARVLHIGAHPDDENTSLLAELALGQGADVAYLALTRGEGGQNGIGPELQEGLGLIRSEELLAARRLDGARQFFSRAYDYGYSKSADEAFRHWDHDAVLADVVAVIRTYRPDVVVAVFSGTPSDGHGQHQVSGIVAREAVLAAGDPSRFPEQIAAGLEPFRPARFFRSSRFRSGDGTIVAYQTGERDPLLGRSHHQVAMASRSRHRSQDMGVPQAPGPRETDVIEIDPATNRPVQGAHLAGIFDGLQTTLAGRADAAASATGGEARAVLDRVGLRLERYDTAIAEARAAINPLHPAAGIQRLAALHRTLEEVDAELDGLDNHAVQDFRFYLRREMDDVAQALLRAADAEVDVLADDERIAPRQDFEVRVQLWNGDAVPVTVKDVRPITTRDWYAAPGDQTTDDGRDGGFRSRVFGAANATSTAAPPADVAPGGLWLRTFDAHVRAGAEPTQPYYLKQPRDGDLYRWPDDYAIRNLPFQPDPIRFTVTLEIGGATFQVERSAVVKVVDAHQGELRRPVAIVPGLAVSLSPASVVVPSYALGDRTLEVTASLTSEATNGLDGMLTLQAPDGWEVDGAAVPVHFQQAGETQTVRFRVHPPAGAAHGTHALKAVVRSGEDTYATGYQLVDYPHIRPHRFYHDATTTVRVLDVRVADGLLVGYVAGAGDYVPEALGQLGVRVESLGPQELANADLDRYDVVVTGIRAYEVRPDLVAHNARLLEYVHRGGTMVVLYNKYEFPRGNFAPYPVDMARPHDRVTDETAQVTLLRPDHPILSSPNRIGPADWEGWDTERGLYFLHTWDEHFTPLLSMHDPGEAPLEGSLLVARYGSGTYVYTGLSLFRQLPLGVPGAYRILANLVSLGAR